MLSLPVHAAVTFILVHPHYPENVGAAARAIKTMGFTRLRLVKPGRLAVPEHEMARKMAVKSLDVLDFAERHLTLDSALSDIDLAFATTSRRGASGVELPRDAAADIVMLTRKGLRMAIVLGNEKTGLDATHAASCERSLRIPMASDQPSINLAQAVQVLAYELFVAGLAERNAERTLAGLSPEPEPGTDDGPIEPAFDSSSS